MSELAIVELFDAPITFTNRERPVPADDRAIWRVPFVLLLVNACWGKKATAQQLHVLSWALRSTSSASDFRALFDGQEPPERAVVRFEPALDRAVNLAAGLSYITLSSGAWTLTDAGNGVCDDVLGDQSLFADVREKLDTLGGPLTQLRVRGLFQRQIGSA